MTKVQSHMILALHNLKMVPSNVKKKKKIRVQLNVAKVLSCVMLILLNVIKEPLSVRKRWGNYWMWQKYNHMWCWYCPIWWWNCQMWVKIKVPSNVTKVRSNKMLVLPNVTMKPSNVRKKNNNKGTIVTTLPNYLIIDEYI